MKRLAATAKRINFELRFGLFLSQSSKGFWELKQEDIELIQHSPTSLVRLFRSLTQLYADGIKATVAPPLRCFDLKEPTKIRMQRPRGCESLHQSHYSDHKRTHCLKYQTITTPDDLVFTLHEPIAKRRHDPTLHSESRWENVLQIYLQVCGEQHYMYGEAAHLLEHWKQRPFCKDLAPLKQMVINFARSNIVLSLKQLQRPQALPG